LEWSVVWWSCVLLFSDFLPKYGIFSAILSLSKICRTENSQISLKIIYYRRTAQDEHISTLKQLFWTEIGRKTVFCPKALFPMLKNNIFSLKTIQLFCFPWPSLTPNMNDFPNFFFSYSETRHLTLWSHEILLKTNDV
jgi:hypothetical protein